MSEPDAAPVLKPSAQSLDEAIADIESLPTLPPIAQQPCIEAQSKSLTYTANYDTNFEDRNGFLTGIARFMEEATVHSQLNELLEEGHGYAVMLYTWRSISRAEPKVCDEERDEVSEKLIEILEPEINKLYDLMNFQKKAIERFCGEVKNLCHQARKNEFVSEAYLLTLGKFLNMFAVLDALKNIKASLKNDHARYKRAKQSLKLTNPADLDESHTLTMFLANRDDITNNLQANLEKISGYEDLLADIINICSYQYESKMYLSPTEKHILLKVMGFCLSILDGTVVNIYKMDSKKKINLSKIDKFFKNLEVVPLYGDMQITLFTYIQRGRNYEDNKSRWSCSGNTVQYNILEHLNVIRSEHTTYIADLTRYGSKEVSSKNKQKSLEENRALYNLALRGLKLLASWTAHVMELFSWKLVHPVSDLISEKICPKGAEEYERATRYNYSSEEKFALVEVIAMIKGLQRLISRMENVFTDAILSTVYTEIQIYTQKSLREPLRIATKKKKTLLLTILRSIRDTSADWLHGVEPSNDPALKGEKDPKSAPPFSIDIGKKRVGPSTTQLYMTRTMSESLITDRSIGGKKTIKKDLDGSSLVAIENFHRRSFFYNHMLNFAETLQKCSDLSQFWYREFYLEMTMGNRIQFPIDMSMPWILTNHILETKQPEMMEYVLYPLDLYNDSAHYTLNFFKKQFLYDEVEAEVNLCFDQFVYKLSDQIFAYYKQQAGYLLLNKKFKNDWNKFYTEKEKKLLSSQTQGSIRYEPLLKQRHVQILGRSVDLNQLISQRVQASLQTALDLAISKFESSDLTGIIELEALLNVNELTHKLLAKYMKLTKFSEMLREANRTVQAPYGRITLHIFWELNSEFLPKYCYNASTDRFTKAKADILLLTTSDESEREKAPSARSHFFFGSKILNVAYSKICSLYTNFIGSQHFHSMVRLLGYHGIAVILEETLKTMKNIIQGVIMDYVKALMEAMPKSCGLPRSEYGCVGMLGFYEAKLNSILQYPDLRTLVFQKFRELGNAILFCRILEQSLTKEELNDLLLAAPFRKVFPRPYVKSKDSEKVEAKLKNLEKMHKSMNVVSVIDKLGTQKQIKLVKDSHLLTRERLCIGLSLFKVILEKIQEFLTDAVWNGVKKPANDVMNVDECVEFHRLWSAMQYVICLPLGENELFVEEGFGEGLNWAGCTIIRLLKQQYRFEAFDFCYHIKKIHEVEKKDENVRGVSVKRMVKRIERFQTLNNEIFASLDKFLGSHDTDTKLPLSEVRHFQPPEKPEGDDVDVNVDVDTDDEYD
uniref:Cytoplasmic FMR1-interacting protein n=1 Tax=Saccoglossus kowalevskii TaxID=10224 RepID=A0ABM0GIV1_SACKO|nr:PREDICTED: cytoplasmic FMR1-interacting protein 2-like [Saccoglossus kowalevskii]